jgi:hypothetical protein
VALVFGGLDEDRGQVEHLVTARWKSVRGRGLWQRSVTVSTSVGKEGNDMVALEGRFEEAGGALVTRLAAGLAVGGRRLGRALGSFGRIGGRRARGILGVLVEARFQESQTGFQLGDAGLEGPAAGTFDRRRAHTAGFKR